MNGYVTSAALQAEPEREEVLPAAAAEIELVSTELPVNETPVLAASSSAGSRDIIEEVAPLHVDFAGLAQLLVHMDPANDSFVKTNRQWPICESWSCGVFLSCAWAVHRCQQDTGAVE